MKAYHQLSTKKAWPWLWLSLLIIILDQLSKYVINQHLQVEQSVKLLPFLNLDLNYNTGAAFSFLQAAGGWQIILLSGISIVATIILFVWICMTSRRDWLMASALSLILGGAIGNLIDRVRLRYVIDFVDFHIGAWHFATFNLADSAITVGAIMLVLKLFLIRGE